MEIRCQASEKPPLRNGVKHMWKKVFLASAVTGLLTAAVSLQSTPADAAHSGCSRAAMVKYPSDLTARKEFKHWCKGQWKIYKAVHKGGPKAPA